MAELLAIWALLFLFWGGGAFWLGCNVGRREPGEPFDALDWGLMLIITACAIAVFYLAADLFGPIVWFIGLVMFWAFLVVVMYLRGKAIT